MPGTTRAAEGVTFGAQPAFSSEQIDYHLSDDKKSFQITFDRAIAAGVGPVSFDGVPKSDAPVNTRVYSAVIPAMGKNVKTAFVVNGFGSTEAGANTVLVMSVNDQHSVTHFKPNTKDGAFFAKLPFTAKAVDDVRLTLMLVAEHDATHPDGTALIAINTIAADSVFKKPKGRNGKARKKTK
jgi:hypothetical protein